ncbi:MAG: thioredoxin fold domain-containing protein [Pseudomonadales bacterium]|jgi:thiol:disulfide interchange protein DsbC|nr:thioredoxin fold domain-containing protein [Pseudomonadales bacterium]
MRKAPSFCRARFGALLVLLLPLLLAGRAALADEADSAEVAAIRELLISTQPNIQVGSITPSPIEGLYEVAVQNGNTIYVSRDAKYLIPGDLYESGENGLVNHGDERRNAQRREKVAAIDEQHMVVFEAEGERKATLTVFTDVDCPYCRKLHEEVAELNHNGIAVRYLAFPRTGLGTETHRKMISTWCAENPQAMMTSAKRGGGVPEADCDRADDIAIQYRLGREVGVTGTPALLFEDGSLVPGYVPAATLIPLLLEQSPTE